MADIRELKNLIRKAYGENINLVRVVTTEKGKRFIFNDLLSELYNKEKDKKSRNIKNRNFYTKAIKKGNIEKMEILSNKGKQYTALIDDIGLIELIAHEKNLIVLTYDELQKIKGN